MRPQIILRVPRSRATVGIALSIALSAAVAAPLASIAVSATATPVAISSARSGLSFGDRAVVRGHVARAEQGRRVDLEFRPAGEGWRTVAHSRVARDGAFVVSAPVARSGRIRARLAPEASVAISPTPATGGTAVSPSLSIAVAARVSTTRRHLEVLRGSRAGVEGTLRPGRAGRMVRLEGRLHGRWRTIARDRTDRRGRFDVRFVARQTTSIPVRVTFRGDRANHPAIVAAGRLNAYRKGLASWYDAVGGSLACGGHLHAGQLGVANKSLPCGTMVTFRHAGRTVRVPVIDRGPYAGGREWDLTGATARRLRFDGVGTVWSTR